MTPIVIILLVILGVGLLLGFWLVGIYNGLVVARTCCAACCIPNAAADRRDACRLPGFSVSRPRRLPGFIVR